MQKGLGMVCRGVEATAVPRIRAGSSLDLPPVCQGAPVEELPSPHASDSEHSQAEDLAQHLIGLEARPRGTLTCAKHSASVWDVADAPWAPSVSCEEGHRPLKPTHRPPRVPLTGAYCPYCQGHSGFLWSFRSAESM